jgi:hypothetical protein
MPTPAPQEDPIKLELKQGNTVLAVLSLSVVPTSAILATYTCVLDENTAKPVVFEGIPNRVDPLQVATDALAAFGYTSSGRKPNKAAKNTRAPQL